MAKFRLGTDTVCMRESQCYECLNYLSVALGNEEREEMT